LNRGLGNSPLYGAVRNEISIFCAYIANALALAGDYDNALVWLKRSVDWGFSNHKFLINHNRFLEPLRDDLRFLSIVDQARKQQEAFKD